MKTDELLTNPLFKPVKVHTCALAKHTFTSTGQAVEELTKIFYCTAHITVVILFLLQIKSVYKETNTQQTNTRKEKKHFIILIK